MRRNLSLLLLVLAALCLTTVNAASTLKYQYTYTDADKDITTKPETNPAYVPMYDLGILQTGLTLQITVNVPNDASATVLEKSIAAGLLLYF
jgi:hypothetical protein